MKVSAVWRMLSCWDLSIRPCGGFAARWLACLANCGWTFLHTSRVSFKALQRGNGGGGGSQRGEVSPSWAAWAGCCCCCCWDPLSALTSTAAMLKFFSGRDDENESLLGAVTEGKSCEQLGTDASLRILPTTGWFCGTLLATQKTLIQHFSPRTNRISRNGDQWVPPPHTKECPGGRAECRIAAGLLRCERIKHLHVWWMRHRPGKRALQSAASVKPRRLFGGCSTPVNRHRQHCFNGSVKKLGG